RQRRGSAPVARQPERRGREVLDPLRELRLRGDLLGLDVTGERPPAEHGGEAAVAEVALQRPEPGPRVRAAWPLVVLRRADGGRRSHAPTLSSLQPCRSPRCSPPPPCPPSRRTAPTARSDCTSGRRTV